MRQKIRELSSDLEGSRDVPTTSVYLISPHVTMVVQVCVCVCVCVCVSVCVCVYKLDINMQLPRK